MRIYKILSIFTVGATLAACNEALVPDYNTPTGFPHAVSALQGEYTGLFSRVRPDLTAWSLSMDGFARLSAYYTPSEERFVTELTGESPLDDDNFGAGVWNLEYSAVKSADSIIGVLPTLNNNGAALPTANVQALLGVAETIKALNYSYIALSHDTNGVAINEVGGPITGNLAPILCAADVWKEIIAILDTAQSEFNAAGLSTTVGLPGTTLGTLQVPPGYAALGTTAGGWMNLVYALRGKARIEAAYAIARGPAGNAAGAPTATSAGSPDQNQLDSAIIDIQASSLYSSSLSAGEAIAFNDIGVFHSFSSAAGDVVNPLFGFSASIFVMEGAAQQIDTLHDQRFLAKFGPAPALPTSEGALTASSYAYFNNIGLSTPMPIVRNVELQFLLARAYLGTNQLAKAAMTVDAVRTTVGGLASGLSGVDVTSYTSVRDFLMREMIPSLMDDGTGDQIAAIRDLGLIMTDLDTWALLKAEGFGTDYHTSMENIPAIERQQRNNNYATVCP